MSKTPFATDSVTAEDLQPGTLLLWKNPKLFSLKHSQLEFHFHIVVKSEDGKHLLLPLTSSCPNESFWHLAELSQSITLPSPYHGGKPSFFSTNLIEWFTTEELLALPSTELGYLDYLDGEDWSAFCSAFSYDLWKNLPTTTYHGGWWKKFQKTFVTPGYQHGWLPGWLAKKCKSDDLSLTELLSSLK